jgi:PAS domain S-box-containing protein
MPRLPSYTLFDVPENRFSYINKEIFYVLGYTIEEVLQMGADAARLIYHPDDWHLLPERQISEKKFQHSDSMMQYECRVKAKDGSWCWLLVREVIFKTGEDGSILQILGAALDITRRKDMEKTLMQNALHAGAIQCQPRRVCLRGQPRPERTVA